MFLKTSNSKYQIVNSSVVEPSYIVNLDTDPDWKCTGSWIPTEKIWILIHNNAQQLQVPAEVLLLSYSNDNLFGSRYKESVMLQYFRLIL